MREGSVVANLWGKGISKVTEKYKVDERGWIHVHNFSEEEIRGLLARVLALQDKIGKIN